MEPQNTETYVTQMPCWFIPKLYRQPKMLCELTIDFHPTMLLSRQLFREESHPIASKLIF